MDSLINRNLSVYVAILYLLIFVNVSDGADSESSGSSGTSEIPKVRSPTVKDFDKWLTTYVQNKKDLVLLLDYDGTLVPLSGPNMSDLPNETVKVLKALAKLPHLEIFIVTARNVPEMKQLMGSIKGINFAGSHGCEILYKDGISWNFKLEDKFKNELESLAKVLEQKVCMSGTKARVARNAASIAFICSHSPPSLLPKLLEDGMKEIKQFPTLRSIPESIDAETKVIEAKAPIDWDKGIACIDILTKKYGERWYETTAVFYVGDTISDENPMEKLGNRAISFRVTELVNLKTNATHKLPNIDSVRDFLNWIERKWRNKVQNKALGSSRGPRKKSGGKVSSNTRSKQKHV